MATRNFVPRKDGEGSIGKERKHWGSGYFRSIDTCLRNTAYTIADIAYSNRFPSWARLECVKSGITAASLPIGVQNKAGQLIQDGTVVWLVDDIRDGARVGDIILRPTLHDGFVKANGATVKASEYPRLLAWVQASTMLINDEQYMKDCSKYVYNELKDTLKLPNAVGVLLQGGEGVRSIAPGLPNITGHVALSKGAPYKAHPGTFEVMQENNNAFYTEGWLSKGNSMAGEYDIPSGGNSTLRIDASKTSKIYGNADTVQPPAITMIAQIKY